jgi:hypothetical protein
MPIDFPVLIRRLPVTRMKDRQFDGFAKSCAFVSDRSSCQNFSLCDCFDRDLDVQIHTDTTITAIDRAAIDRSRLW